MSEAAGDSEHGFALIEVLVAFAIVSLCLASLYTAIGGSSRQSAMVDLHRQSLEYAEGHLQALGDSVMPGADALAGDYPNGTRWQLSLAPIAVGDAAAADPGPRPFLVLLQVFDRTGHRVVALNSIKIFPVQPQ
jgi:general secretion pathway protein I